MHVSIELIRAPNIDLRAALRNDGFLDAGFRLIYRWKLKYTVTVVNT